MTNREILKKLCETITGKDSNGNSIAEVLNDINKNYPERITADVDIVSDFDLFGKKIGDLQSAVTVKADEITGVLKYVTDYTGFSSVTAEQSGNYLALQFSTSIDDDIVVELVGGTKGPITLDEDRICVFRITNTSTQSIKVTVGSKTKTYSLSNLVLEENS